MTTSTYNDVISAYQGVEQLERFTGEQLAAYRRELLDRTAGQAELIARYAPADASMVEIGTGNGRLLVTLAQQHQLSDALGIDISASRIEFARRWAQDLGLDRLRFEAADAMTADLPDQVDVAVCITGAFAYFDAIQPNAGKQLLERLRDSLKPGGSLVLELYPHPAWRGMLEGTESQELRLWKEMPESDPWQFYLSHLRFSPDTQILAHHKTFVHRSTGEIDRGRSEHIRLYDPPGIRAELQETGYDDIATYGDWSGRAHRPDDEQLIVIARRA